MTESCFMKVGCNGYFLETNMSLTIPVIKAPGRLDDLTLEIATVYYPIN